MEILKNYKRRLREAQTITYFTPECDYCHEKLIMNHNEFEEIKSSDLENDVFKFKCCNCGHIVTLTRQQLNECKNNWTGENCIVLFLDENESKSAKEFIKEHLHKDGFLKKNKIAFSALGHQFTYMISVGGLGNSFSIKCNHCNKTKNITNTDNW